MRFKDKVAIVTGGSRGIGRAIALGLAEEGALVVIIYRSNHQAAEETVRLADGYAGSIRAFQASVTDYKTIQQIVRSVKKKHGSIDILVNNAGILRVGFLATMKPSEWDEVIDVNLKGTLCCSSAVARIMMAQKIGRIINISSIAAFRGFAGQVAYAASKAGIVAVTRCLARELGQYGILVNGIAPGLVETEMIDVLATEIEEKEVVDPEDIAHLVFLLASDDARMIQGQTLLVTGNPE